MMTVTNNKNVREDGARGEGSRKDWPFSMHGTAIPRFSASIPFHFLASKPPGSSTTKTANSRETNIGTNQSSKSKVPKKRKTKEAVQYTVHSIPNAMYRPGSASAIAIAFTITTKK